MKTVMIIFNGDQGSGKTILSDLICAMFDSNKIHYTRKNNEDTILVTLNEDDKLRLSDD